MITVDFLLKLLYVRMCCPLCNTELVLAETAPANASVFNAPLQGAGAPDASAMEEAQPQQD